MSSTDKRLEEGSASPGPEPSAPTTIERWLVMPKVLYFMLNMYVYAFHGILYFIFIEDWKWPPWMFALATSVTAANFVGSLIWGPLADKTGRYKTIIAGTAAAYTLCACLLVFPVNTGISIVDGLCAFLLLGLFNFFLSAPFPLVDSQVMGLLASRPYYSRSQFGNQRMFGCIGHFIATLVIFSIKGKVKGMELIGIKAERLCLAVFQIVITGIFLAVVFFGVPNVKPVKAGHHGHHGHAKKKAAAPEGASPSAVPSPALSAASTTSTGSSSASLAGNPVQPVPLEKALPFAPTPAPPNAASELLAEELPRDRRHPAVQLLTDGNFLFLMAFICCAGIVRSVTGSFTKGITVVVVHGDMFRTALTEGTRVLSEIAIYLMAGWLKSIMGVYWILVSSQIVGIARMLGYGLLPVGWAGAEAAIYVLELLKGFGSGLISSSAIAIANDIAPEGCEATAQGLYSGMYSGFSSLFAGLLSAGILYSVMGKRLDPKDLGAANLGMDAKALEALAKNANTVAEALEIQILFNWISALTSLVTVAMAAKYIFIDRVMGLPGFPRRRSSLSAARA